MLLISLLVANRDCGLAAIDADDLKVLASYALLANELFSKDAISLHDKYAMLMPNVLRT